MRILVADDNPVFQSVLQAMLTNWGYEVVVASDGEQAWSTLQSDECPRLAVLDWRMPGLTGIEVCRLLRARHRSPYTYVLILTAKTSGEDLAAALEAGADDFVTKPFKSAEFRARLRAGRRILDLEDKLLLAQQIPSAPFSVCDAPAVRPPC